jgi:hypothetical protein
LPASPIAIIEAHVPTLADDDVVEDADAHEFTGGAKALLLE